MFLQKGSETKTYLPVPQFTLIISKIIQLEILIEQTPQIVLWDKMIFSIVQGNNIYFPICKYNFITPGIVCAHTSSAGEFKQMLWASWAVTMTTTEISVSADITLKSKITVELDYSYGGCWNDCNECLCACVRACVCNFQREDPAAKAI